MLEFNTLEEYKNLYLELKANAAQLPEAQRLQMMLEVLRSINYIEERQVV